MPKIQQTIQTHIDITRRLLSELPPPPSPDPRSEILSLLHNFTTDLDRHIYGISADFESGLNNGLIQSIRPSHERFKRLIRNTAPIFLTSEKPARVMSVTPHEVVTRSSSYDEPQEVAFFEYVSPSVHTISFLQTEEGDITQTTPESEWIYIDEVMEIANK